MKVVLIRHPAPMIAPGICYGRLDIKLHPATDGQVTALAGDPALRGIGLVWSSPAIRCRTVADRIVQATGGGLTVDDRLRELDFGDWEGRAWDTIDRAALDRWAGDPWSFAPPNGESGAAIVSRVRAFHASMLHDGRDCAVVSHGGPLKILAALLQGRRIDLLAAPPALGSVHAVTVAGWSNVPL
jgi:alpha-ribazole phosphatase